MWVQAAHTEQKLSNDVKREYRNTIRRHKKKLHLLVLISEIYLSLRFGYFWDTLYNES